MMDLLLAGGVDGRIHVWNSKDMGNQPLFRWSAHDGRVNCLCFLDQQSQHLLLSGSHDGSVKCWSMKHVPHHVLVNEKRRRKNEVQTFELANQVNLGEARITAITSCYCNKDDGNDMKHCFAFATHNGFIYIATVVMSASTSTNENSVVELCISSKIELPGGPMVNALCCLSHSDGNDDYTTLVIGHSLGLATVEFK
jgi:WD40 repeat protein